MLDIADFLRRNNIRAVELAAAFGCSERTVYNWRRQLPPGVADDLEALEAKKREAGEWPVTHSPNRERMRARRVKMAAAARAAATKEDLQRGGRNAAAARRSKRQNSTPEQ